MTDIFILLAKLIWVPGMMITIPLRYYPEIATTGWVTGITDAIIVIAILAIAGDFIGGLIAKPIGYSARLLVEL